MMPLRASVAAVMLLAGSALMRGQVPSGAVGFRFEPASTAIHWTLGATGHTVHGTFKLKSGEVHIDAGTGQASGLIVVDATSGESGNSARDRHMHQDVIQSDKYGSITFRPTHVSGKLDLAAPGAVTVDGILNLHGDDHPLQLTVALYRSGDSLRAESRFDIPYVAWGMKDPGTFLFRVEKQVHIEVTTSAVAIPLAAPVH